MPYRIRDLILSITALLLSSWLFLLICIALAATQKRVFFVQERTGYKGKAFKLIKFSTLRDILPGEREEDNQKARLTVMGRILRRLSLDELPQLINVLAGNMSLVGPRPLIHEYWTLYSERQKGRFEVLPGITGWAQVNGRNALTFTERFELDLEYISRRSMAFDFKIMWLTIARVFSGGGVYVDQMTTAEKFNGKN